MSTDMTKSWRLLLVTVGLSLAICTPANAGRHLKAAIEVATATVTLADVFEGDPADPAWAGVLVSQAPLPGSRILVRSSQIVDVARNAGARWDSATTAQTITISRRGIAVPPEVIEKRISSALPSARARGDVQLTATGHTLMVASASDFAEIRVSRLHYDNRSDSFNATLSYPDGNNGTNNEIITGRIIAMIDLPVLNDTLVAGEIISSDNIDWLRIPARQATAQVVANADDIIGMAAKRALRPGVPLHLTDIQRPRLVKRGDLVTMVLASPSITLTATGKALENGAKGDRIRLVNTASHRTVEATVVSPQQVMVSTNMRVAAQDY